jgi:hypothetical protein
MRTARIQWGGANTSILAASTATNGANNFDFFSGANQVFQIAGGASTVNYLSLTSTSTGNALAINAIGTDSNINIYLYPKGNGNVGIGTTTPGQKLSVAGDILGNNIIASNFTATSTTASSTLQNYIFANGQGTSVSLSGGLSANSLNTNSLNVGSVTGPLQAVNGAVSATSSLAVGYGGTGITNPTAAGILVGSYSGGSWQQLSTSTLGLLTTNVAEGTNLYYSDARVNTYVNASTTIPKTYTNNTFAGNNTFNGTLTVGSLTGPISAANGLLSASSTLAIAYGGTGVSTYPTYGQLLLGNSTGGYSLTATSSLGINLSDLVGTLAVNKGGTGQTSFNQGWLGINDAGAFISSTSPTVNYLVATSTTASSTLQNFGFTNGQGTSLSLSGGLSIGSLLNAGVITNTNLANSSVTVNPGSGLSGGGAVSLGGNVTLSSALAFNPLVAGYVTGTSSATSTYSGGLYASLLSAPYFNATSTTASSTLQNYIFANGQGTSVSLSGGLSANSLNTNSLNVGSVTGPLQAVNGAVSATSSLAVGYGGTGITNPTAAGILVGSYSGGSWQQLSTSTLGLLTTNVAEGTNLYYSDARVNTYVNASTTIPKTYTNNTFAGNNTFNGTLTVGSLTGPISAANGLLSASSTLAIAYGGTGVSTYPTYGQLLLGNSTGGYSLTATSSLGINFSSLVGTLGVAQGGTGATTFGQGWLFSSGGTGALNSSTSPTINYIFATSTSVASILPYASTTAIPANSFVPAAVPPAPDAPPTPFVPAVPFAPPTPPVPPTPPLPPITVTNPVIEYAPVISPQFEPVMPPA